MEKFFEQRVAIAPYRATALLGWARAWGAPAAALPSLVALMRADLVPVAPALWTLHWVLRIPPAGPPIVPAGQPAVLLAKHKILFFVSPPPHRALTDCSHHEHSKKVIYCVYFRLLDVLYDGNIFMVMSMILFENEISEYNNTAS